MVRLIKLNKALILRIVKVAYRILISCWFLLLVLIGISLIIYWLFGAWMPIVFITILILGILYNLEDQLLYHPELPPHSRLFVSVPSIFGLPYESAYTTTIDGTLVHMFIILQPKISTEVPTVLYLHGNAGNVGHRLQNVVEIYRNLQLNVVMLEYRGYGLSQGKPTEAGLYQDAIAALDFIASRKDFKHSEIIVFGRSLGGAVAIDVASNPVYSDKIWCLIVENTFTSIPDMANVIIGWRILKKVPLICYKSKFLSKSKVLKLKIPTLFISGSSDTLVPPRMMQQLYDVCSSEHKQLVRFENGTHNETWHSRGYYAAIGAFLGDARKRVTAL